MNRAGREVAVVGVGYSDVTRRGEPDIRVMTHDAALDALGDAGLVATDLDAIFEYSFGMMRGDSPIAVRAQRLLGVPNLTAFNDIMGTGPSGLASAMDAAMAISAGACETALVYRTITREAGHNGGLHEGPTRAARPDAVRRAVRLRRRDHPRDGDEEASPHRRARRVGRGLRPDRAQRPALGRAVSTRDVPRRRSRWTTTSARASIADPLLLFDCDYPVNAACAAVLTTAERAADLRQPAVLVDALAYGTGSRPDWLYTDDFLFGGTDPVRAASCGGGRRSTAADVDVAELYDGFTHIAISWLEALGLCGIGEFHDWVDDGARIGPGGSMPLNTYGGQLAAGRMHGLAFLNEAVLQVRGDAGDRQVPDARVAVVANAHGPQCGAMVVRRRLAIVEARCARQCVEAPALGRRADPPARRVGPTVDVDRGAVDVGAHRRAQEHRRRRDGPRRHPHDPTGSSASVPFGPSAPRSGQVDGSTGPARLPRRPGVIVWSGASALMRMWCSDSSSAIVMVKLIIPALHAA